MFDQSFSADNFRNILDYENRKGVYLEGKYFPEIKKITEQIKKCNTDLRAKEESATSEEYEIFKKETNDRKEKLKEEKEEKLKVELQRISDIIVRNKFRVPLAQKDNKSGKPIYTTEDKPENYFALKQIQYNFRKLYKVKQASRFAILSQLRELLGDNFPKYVIKTDIQEFYESIPHDKLLQRLNEENLLSFYSKKIISQILKEYENLSGSKKGLPRGIGISAYLSELYMRDFDKLIRSWSSVSYYARYVDDIIIIITPTSRNESKDFIAEIRKILELDFLLQLNDTKTDPEPIDLVTKDKLSLEYLGYRIKYENKKIEFKLSSKKIDKYKKRIDLILDSYINFSKVNEKKARKLLVKRLKYLTGNTRLVNNKKNVLVGVYYSNNLLTDDFDFIALDKYLAHKIETEISSSIVKKRLNEYKFQHGFNSKRFTPFTANDLSEILKIWQNK